MSEDAPLYLRLADRLGHLAASGSLRPGTRLPSLRTLSEQHEVSISTAAQAYRTLEDRGVIEARPKSGFFVRMSRQLPPVPAATRPPTRAVTVELKAIADTVFDLAADPTCISFGAACAGESLYATERIRRALARSAQRHAGTLGQYAVSPGLPALRQAISRRALDLGCNLDHQQVVVTNGCAESIALCLQTVTRPGDVVAIESPTYFGTLRSLHALGLKALEIPMQPGEGLSIEALELALQTQPVKAIVAVPTVSNPLGTLMPAAGKKRLAALLERHRVPLIEDVICNELAPTEDDRRAVRAFDRHGWVMLCSSFGKTLSPGLRGIGWVEGGRWAAEVASLKRALSGGGTTVVEHAVADLLQHGGYDQSLRQLRRRFGEHVRVARELVGQAFPAGTRVTDPAAGYVLWLELPRGVDSIELYQRCLERRIVVVPGPLFTTSSRYRNCLRLSVGVPWTPEREDAFRTIGRIAQEMVTA